MGLCVCWCWMNVMIRWKTLHTVLSLVCSFGLYSLIKTAHAARLRLQHARPVPRKPVWPRSSCKRDGRLCVGAPRHHRGAQGRGGPTPQCEHEGVLWSRNELLNAGETRFFWSDFIFVTKEKNQTVLTKKCWVLTLEHVKTRDKLSAERVACSRPCLSL